MSGPLHVPRWTGRIKSYQPGNGYGFIECSEAYHQFGRDVYLSGQELQKLDIMTIPVGTEVLFDIELRGGRPRARNLSGLREQASAECLPERTLKQCEYRLDQYANALRELSHCLHLYGLDRRSYNALKQAEGMLRCQECRRDEHEGCKVLRLISEAAEKWTDASHPCHQSLREGLLQRCSPPPCEPIQMSIDRIRFTQEMHSKRFLNGPHAGQRIEWLTDQLLSGAISFSDPSVVLNVVYFHGAYRGLRMDDGSEQDVIRKFLRANDTSSDGTSIECKRRFGQVTVVNQEVQIHVSNLDRSVQEAQLQEHLLAAGVSWPFQVKIARRPNGQSNCYGWITTTDPDQAEELLQMSLPPLRGRELRMRLDNVSAIKQPSDPGKGWLRCQACRETCEPLVDVLLVEGIRHRRDHVSPGRFDEAPTFFCVGREASLLNCEVISPHPDAAGTSFKLSQVLCKTCGEDLGNVQKGSLMQGEVMELLGERVVHFKCASVLLELPDRQDLLLDVRKWQYLAQATGRDSIYRLSQLTMSEAAEVLGLNLNSKASHRNSKNHARVIPRERPSVVAGASSAESGGPTKSGYPTGQE
ncbi:Uncharacterized protein (Fragment) [Durusdinium trenchii]|uniref:Uncharacterized protein n=1 Tax=Durusdinium trenchii TaxID=1381693 RepID=A0ABP0NXM9_9DINO